MSWKIPSWLKKAVFYQIYPQSFYDSNDDGIGDIPGIIAKLDYLETLGVTGLWINPCYVSPFQDAGYDVADYYKVAPRYGTNQDLKNLFTAAKNRGIRILLDLVPGHTSIQHPWSNVIRTNKKQLAFGMGSGPGWRKLILKRCLSPNGDHLEDPYRQDFMSISYWDSIIQIGSGQPTFYARLGDWAGWLGIAGVVFFTIGSPFLVKAAEKRGTEGKRE